MPSPLITRIQLCGQFAVLSGDRRLDQELPGRRARLVVAYLAARRREAVSRDRLAGDLWPDGGSAAATLTVLLSKIRAALGHDTIQGRAQLRLMVPASAVVDTEAALVGLHRAESAVALGHHRRAWAHVLTALFVSGRPFLVEYDHPWVLDERQRFELVRQRALACYAEVCLGLRGTELPGAERAARELIGFAPLSESGHRLLMRAQAAIGDTAAALRTYQHLRTLLADELGVDPDPHTQQLFQDLLAGRRGGGG